MNDPEIEAAVVENNEEGSSLLALHTLLVLMLNEGINGIKHVNGLRVSKFNLNSLTIVWKHSCRIVSSTDLREWLASKKANTQESSAEHGRK